MRRGRLTGGLILVLVGLIFLLSNIGLLSVAPWRLVAAYWPLLLIVAGVAMLFGASGRWVVIALLVVVVGAAALGVPFGLGQRTQTSIVADPLVAGASRLDVQLVVDAGLVRSRGAGSELYSLNLTHPAGTKPVHTTVLDGDLARLRVESRGRAFVWMPDGAHEVSLSFSREAELDLSVRLSAGEADLDLTPYNLGSLSVAVGAGQVAVRLGEVSATVPVQISVSAGDLVVYVPESIGLRVTGGAKVGSTEFKNTGLRQVGTGWEDDAYTSAEDRIDLDLTVAVGQVAVRRY